MSYLLLLMHLKCFDSTEMLQTKEMNLDERLANAKFLFDSSIQRDEKRAMEKRLEKRKRQSSGTSMTSTISSISSMTKEVSPPNKRLRGLAENSDGETEESQSSLPIKKRGNLH